MKGKRVKVLLLIVFSAAVAGFMHYYNPLAPAKIDDILSKELNGMPHLRHKGKSVGMLPISRAELMKKYERDWKETEVEIRKAGASKEELEGIMRTARKHFSGTIDGDSYMYGVPVRARRIWIKFKPIWIVDFRWGIGEKGGFIESPDHVQAIAIDARKPYNQLGMASCN